MALLAAITVAALVARFVSAETSAPKIEGVQPLSEETIDKVVMRDSEQEAIIVKRDGRWWVREYPVVLLKLNEMWETAEVLKDAELISVNPENHAAMGVDVRNTTVVQFWSGDKLIHEFLIGDKQLAPIGEKLITPWTVWARLCYLRYPDQDETYGVFCEFPERFDTRFKYWVHPIAAEAPRDEIQAITYVYPDGQFSLHIVNSTWVVTSESGTQVADPQSVLDLLRKAEMVVADDFPTQDEISRLDFSISDIQMAIITREGSSQPSSVLQFLEKEHGAYYVKNADLPYVYILEAPQVAEYLKREQDLINPPPAVTP